jgi:hypothetical protein
LRNPLAVLHSILDNWVKQDWGKLSLFIDDLIKAPKLLDNGINTLGSGAIVTHYEDLVKKPEETLEFLCERLHVEFHPEILSYGTGSFLTGKMGDKISINKHTRPVRNHLDKWEKGLNTFEYRLISGVCINAIEPEIFNRLGYPLEQLSDKLHFSTLGKKLPSPASITKFIDSLDPLLDKKTNQILWRRLCDRLYRNKKTSICKKNSP